jgi:putative nucleotidyltransferase with HDIG domain
VSDSAAARSSSSDINRQRDGLNEVAGLLEQLRIALDAPGYHAPLRPTAALELVQLASDPEVRIETVRNLVLSDPLVAAQVLRTAQSAYYARGGRITSLDDAITLLGLRRLTELFLQVAVATKVFQVPGFVAPMEELRKHSVVTASLSRSVCRAAGLSQDFAFMCGLLHDVGIAAILHLVSGLHDRCVEFEEIAPCVQALHEDAGGVVARAWELPREVARVMAGHHRCLAEDDPDPLIAAVGVADSIAASQGVPSCEQTSADDAKRAALLLGLSQSDVTRLELEAADLAFSA